MEFFFFMAVAALIAFLALMLQRKKDARGTATHICAGCGAQGMPTQRDKGSGFIEIILWLCFIIPGLIYSIWRRSGLANSCQICRSTDIIPIDSPRGRKLAGEFGAR
jgi:hypothetical protein